MSSCSTERGEVNTKRLGVFGIEIDLGTKTTSELGLNTCEEGEAVAIRSDLKSDCPHCSRPNCFFDCDESQAEDSQESETEARERLEKNRAYDGIETLLLALAGAGVDVEAPAFLEAVETAVESIENNI